MPVASRSALRSNFPEPRAPLIGRAAEIVALRALLLRDDVPLVTVLGPGGVGKTRLAVEAAKGISADFADGAYLVALAGVADPGLVLFTIAQALHAPQGSRRSLSAGLEAFLAPRELLLVLDNFEHLLDAAADLGDLIAAAPNLKVLVTSRSALRLTTEQRFPLSPFATPDPDHLPPLPELASNPAVALFIRAAQSASPDFALNEGNAGAIARICVELDGLPFAIELAAAHVRVLSPHALLTRLSHRLDVLTGGSRDHPLRLQTLRNAIAWSYEALDPAQQSRFRRLSVFAGGFTLEAAEDVLAPPAAPTNARPSVLEDLTDLLDQSLIAVAHQPGGEARFLMLETIREYATAQLEALGEAEDLRRLHAAYFMQLAESAAARLRGREQMAWLALLAQETDNLRAALTWAISPAGDPEVGLRIGAAMTWYWHLRGHHGEGRRWLADLVAHSAGAAPTAARAWSLLGLGMVQLLLGESAEARATLSQAIAAGRALGDSALVGSGLHHTGMIDLLYEGDYHAAETALEASVALFKQSDDRWFHAVALCSVGILHCATSDLTRAQAVLEESLTMTREIGDRWNLARVLQYLGEVARASGDDDRARACYEESLVLFQQLGEPIATASVLHNLGFVACHQRDCERAVQLFAECLTMGWERGANRVVAYCLMGLAGTIGLLGEPERAVRLLGAADALFAATGATFWPVDRMERERNLASIRAVLDDRAFDAALAAGRALTPEATMNEVTAAISAVGRPRSPDQPRPAATAPILTTRERDVLRLLVEGYSNPEIADRLFISRKTASKHVTSILAKLDVESRTAAATQAIRRGLL